MPLTSADCFLLSLSVLLIEQHGSWAMYRAVANEIDHRQPSASNFLLPPSSSVRQQQHGTPFANSGGGRVIDHRQRGSASSSYYGTATQTRRRRTVRCYSCMSEVYGATWNALKWNTVFRNPVDFTNKCERPTSNDRLPGFLDCDDSCITMTEEFELAGRTSKAYIRGCQSKLLAYGMNVSVQNLFARRTSFCGNYSLSTLTRTYGYHDSSLSKLYTVCSCHGDLCNHATSIVFYNGPMLMLLLYLLLW